MNKHRNLFTTATSLIFNPLWTFMEMLEQKLHLRTPLLFFLVFEFVFDYRITPNKTLFSVYVNNNLLTKQEVLQLEYKVVKDVMLKYNIEDLEICGSLNWFFIKTLWRKCFKLEKTWSSKFFFMCLKIQS